MKFENPLWQIRSVNWLYFDWRVRSSKTSLLKRLEDFQNPVLVGGCQRSGTTAVTKLLASAREVTTFQIGIDNELDGARILAGASNFEPNKSSRYCFQVTYLNDSLLELCEVREPFKMVWVIRNPWSVVYSMLYNWRGSALDQLYRSCIASQSDFTDGRLLLLAGTNKARQHIVKACICYCVRSSQLFELSGNLDNGKLLVLDYDQLVSEPKRILPEVFRFAELTLEESQFGMLHPKSLTKASESFSNDERQLIEEICSPTYSRCLEFASLS
jgi:hypothetical protein